MIKILIIGCGGFLGAILRYLMVNFVTVQSFKMTGQSGFPIGTLFVNLMGCFIIGLLGGLMESKHIFSPEVRLFVFIGVLGSFTTFSTFGYDAMSLAREGQILSFINYIGIHLCVGLLAVWGGHFLSRCF